MSAKRGRVCFTEIKMHQASEGIQIPHYSVDELVDL